MVSSIDDREVRSVDRARLTLALTNASLRGVPSSGSLVLSVLLASLALACASACSSASISRRRPPSPGLGPALSPAAAAAATRRSLPERPSSVRPFGLTELHPPVRVDSGEPTQAGETAIAVVGDRLVAAWNDQHAPAGGRWRLGAALSRDGGAVWEEPGILRPDPDHDAVDEGDPAAAADPRTGNLWVAGVRFRTDGNLFVARLRPGAGVFDVPVVASEGLAIPAGYDKPQIAVGPAPGDPGLTWLYLAFSGGLVRSTDLGETWSHVGPLGLDQEVAYHPRVGPDGVLYVSSWVFSGDRTRIHFRRSTDGGGTFAGPILAATRVEEWETPDSSRVPGRLRSPPLPVLALAPDGDLFLVYCDTASVSGTETDLDLFLARSADGGDTWSAPRSLHLGTDGDQILPWLEIDGRGRLHLVHLDSRFHPQGDSDPFGLYDVVYSFSDDDGASWTENRVTETSTSTRDAVWIGGNQFLGDYISLAVNHHGDAIALYPAAPPGGDLDVFTRRISPPSFHDGFESGDASAWSSRRAAGGGDAPQDEAPSDASSPAARSRSSLPGRSTPPQRENPLAL